MLHEALAFAESKHEGQLRTGTDFPMIHHPLAVASLVLRYGGSLAQAQAALLHDTIGEPGVTEAELAKRFGVETARLAFAFADPVPPPAGADGKPADWATLKKAYLAKVVELDETALLVIGCEELHEITELLHDLKHHGAAGWKRYPVHAMQVFWYFREILGILNRSLKDERARKLTSEFGTRLVIMKELVFESAGQV